MNHPLFFLDVLYVHDKVSPDNNVQEIFDILGHLETDSSRSFEVTKNPQRLLLAFTELLGHPMHRSSKAKTHHWKF
jgi:hypothetical protein